MGSPHTGTRFPLSRKSNGAESTVIRPIPGAANYASQPQYSKRGASQKAEDSD